MPDPITPASPAAHTIDLEPDVIKGTLAKPPPAVPLPIGDIALNCFSEASTVAVLMLSRSGGAPTPPVAAALAAGTAALSLTVCVAKSIHAAEEKASIRQALDRCVADGGTPLGVVDGTLTCGVVE